MGVFEMIVLIVLIGTGSGIVMQWLKNKEKKMDVHGGEAGVQTLSRITELEKRVQVLEKIATDKSARLRDEIDNL